MLSRKNNKNSLNLKRQCKLVIAFYNADISWPDFRKDITCLKMTSTCHTVWGTELLT